MEHVQKPAAPDGLSSSGKRGENHGLGQVAGYSGQLNPGLGVLDELQQSTHDKQTKRPGVGQFITIRIWHVSLAFSL